MLNIMVLIYLSTGTRSPPNISIHRPLFLDITRGSSFLDFAVFLGWPFQRFPFFVLLLTCPSYFSGPQLMSDITVICCCLPQSLTETLLISIYILYIFNIYYCIYWLLELLYCFKGLTEFLFVFIADVLMILNNRSAHACITVSC